MPTRQGGKLCEEGDHLRASQSLDDDNFALGINAVNLKDALGEINTNGGNLHVDDPIR
jgi:hypothetical protein